MRVGITYDLRETYLRAGYGGEETAEFDSPETLQALAATLRDLGHSPDPVGNVRQLVQRLAADERWDLVFNIAEGLRGFGREAQVPALLEAYGIPYTFSDPLTLSLALHKGMAKRVVRDCGIPTPDFAVIETLAEVNGLALPYPLFAKPVAEGTSKGISVASRVESPVELRSLCRNLLARFRQPVLVETFLPGREFTVGITGTGREAMVLGVMEVQLGPAAEREIYSYHNKAHYQGRVEYCLAADELAVRAGEIARAAWCSLGCRDGGRVDVRLDAGGNPQFIEVNPLAGLHPVRSDLVILGRLAGINYHDLIRRILESAAKRQAFGDRRMAAPQRWAV